MKSHARCNAARLKPMAIGLLTTLSVWAVWAGIAHSAGWTDPPAIDMQECVQAHRFMGPNPYSAVPNDFALVTSYQETRADSTKTPDKAFYLLNSVLVDQQHQTGVVYFSSLIVNLSRGGEEHARQVWFWILADTDGDGKLDRAVFRETELSSSGGKRPCRSPRPTMSSSVSCRPTTTMRAES